MALNITPQAILSNVNLGIDLLTNGLNADTVAIFNQQTLRQVFADAEPVDADVRETSRVMDYPVETGVTLSDHHVILPTEIIVTFIIKSDAYNTAYQEMRNAWINATLLMAQTRTGVYRNLVIMQLPHRETQEMFNAVPLQLTLREVIFVVPNSIAGQNAPANYQPRNPVNQNTISRGFQSARNLAGSALGYIRAASVWRL